MKEGEKTQPSVISDKPYSTATGAEDETVPSVVAEEPSKVYTKLFFQRPMTYKQAAAWVFVQYLTIGLIQGYYQSIVLNVQSEGATLSDQSKLSFAQYPYSFKFILSPLMDRFFVNKFGRSKTYIVGGGLIVGSLFTVLGPTITGYIKNLEITPLLILFFSMNSLVCVVQIAGEAWILSMFSKEQKAKASVYLNLGQTLGVVLGFNVFTPLNDVQWLNTYIYTNPVSSPIVTHQMMCFLLAFIYFAQIIVNVLFLAEERIMSDKTKDLCKILMILPRHVTNHHMRNLIIYMFATRFFLYMVQPTTDLRLVQNGYYDMSRGVLSNIDTLCFPIVFCLNYLVIHFTNKGMLLKMYHLNMFFNVMVVAFAYLTYLDLITNKVMIRTIVARCFISITTGLDFSMLFMMSFYNIIVNKAVGNTGITCLIAILNLTSVVSATVGLSLSAINYHVVMISSLSLQMALLFFTWPYSFKLDKKEVTLFDLSEPEKPDPEEETEKLQENN